MNIDVLSKSQISTDEKFHRKCCIIHRRFSRVFIDDKSILDTMGVSYLRLTGYTGLDRITFTTSGGTHNAGVTGSGTHFSMDNICLQFT